MTHGTGSGGQNGRGMMCSMGAIIKIQLHMLQGLGARMVEEWCTF